MIHSAIQRFLAPQQFWGGRPPGLMVSPAFTFSNQFFFLALGIGDALGTKNDNSNNNNNKQLTLIRAVTAGTYLWYGHDHFRTGRFVPVSLNNLFILCRPASGCVVEPDLQSGGWEVRISAWATSHQGLLSLPSLRKNSVSIGSKWGLAQWSEGTGVTATVIVVLWAEKELKVSGAGSHRST